MPTINFHDAIGGQQVGELAVQYDPADPDITLVASLPSHIVTKGPIVDLNIGGQLFKGTAFSVGNTVIAVTPDPQTGDVVHVVGTPVYLVTASSTFEELRDRSLEATPTGETNTALVFAPDGAGGVVARAEDVTTAELTVVAAAIPTALEDLTDDVNIPAPAAGDVLTYVGPNWEAQAPAAAPSALDDLTDVVAPTPATGDVLTFDGADWVPAAPTGGGGGGSGSVHGVRVVRASGDVALSGATVIPFTSEQDDTDGYHDNATNPSRLTVPTGLDGVYVIFGGFYTDAGSDISIRVNGTTGIAFGRAGPGASTLNGYIVSTSYRLAAGDYVELLATPQGSTVVVFDAANASPHFGMYRLEGGPGQPTFVDATGDTTLTPANTMVDVAGLTATLGVGTWLVKATLMWNETSGLGGNFAAKLYDGGSTIYRTGSAVGGASWVGQLILEALIVVASGTVTVKVAARAQRNNDTITRYDQVIGGTTIATWLSYERKA